MIFSWLDTTAATTFIALAAIGAGLKLWKDRP